MMRVEKEMLLHEMHTKDDAHTKELAEMTAGATLCNTLQHTATHCNTLRHTPLQNTATPKTKPTPMNWPK